MTILVLSFLTACGASDQNQSNTTITSQAQTVEVSTAKKTTELNLKLTSTPINKNEFLGLIAPTVTNAPPCPFLTDQTAIETAQTNFNLERRTTSSTECFWSKNAGFSVKVTIEPSATATPIKERVYNMDSPPIIKDQTGPGANAMILYDTTWDKQRAYAMAFEQNNQLVMITVTGMSTNAERLINTANEVSNQLNGVSTSNTNVSDESYNLCNTWSQSEIAAIIGEPIQMKTGNLDCQWHTGSGDSMKQIRITIYSGKSYPWNSVLEYRGSKAVDGIGERGIIEKKRKRSNMPGHILLNTLYQEKLVTVTITETIEKYEAVALALAKNIDQRFELK